MFNLKFFIVLIGIFLGVGFSHSVQATMVMPMGLQSMVRQADRIFLGKVLVVEQDLDEQNIPTTYLRLQVLQGIKGVASGSQVLLKQYAPPPRQLGGILGMSKSQAEVPMRLQVGDEAVLMIYPDSRYGFTSPVGFGQGAFIVSQETDRQVVSNIWQNHFLHLSDKNRNATTLPSLSLPAEGGPIELNSFLTTVRKVVGP